MRSRSEVNNAFQRQFAILKGVFFFFFFLTMHCRADGNNALSGGWNQYSLQFL